MYIQLHGRLQCDTGVYPENHIDIFALLFGILTRKRNNTQPLITKELAILREGGNIKCF